VTKQEPTTKVNFTTTVAQKAVDKIDLLFMVDNSASMADKQQFLAAAVPDLLTRLLTPNCVDAQTGNPTGQISDPTKPDGQQCPAPSQPEFKPITDIHIGLVSSSLGAFGDKSVCSDDPPLNDKGHLITRTDPANPQGATSADAPSGFLAWFPNVAANATKQMDPTYKQPQKPITDSATLTKDFQAIVTGDGQAGCGLEAQLESWYHFLIQPDPWDSVTIDGNNVAHYTGVDDVILQQRSDFLRPDSLVAVIVLSDEDDSFSDPLAVGGQGWAFSVSNFPQSTQARSGGSGTTAPMGTTACDKNPLDPACTSCGFAKNCNASDPTCQAIKNDANCKTNNGYYAGDDDNLNVRFFHMKQRYGVDPQYPIERYVNGLHNKRVPFSTEEHNNAGIYQIATAANPMATTNASCVNPLFATSLPASQAAAHDAAPAKDANGKTLSDADRTKSGLCNLAAGPRAPELVFFANIGGVPNELLHFDPNNPDASKLSGNDWVKILGQSPGTFDYTGIDIHMVQSITPRAGLPPPSATSGDNGTDPINGREWDTLKNDLQYACTFPLPMQDWKTCPKTGDASCADCDGTKNPPLCDTNPLVQTRAKAYPTVRQFEIVHALGDQGIAASLCPRTVGLMGQTLEPDTDSTGKPNPLYGYRPAVKAIVDRLKDALTEQCLPEQLNIDTSNDVPCLILATLPNKGTEDDCNKVKGLSIPAPDILSKFQQSEADQLGGDAAAIFAYPVCVVQEFPTKPGDTCKANTDVGWCYVENTQAASPAGKCPQAIVFSAGTDQAIKGASYSLQCIQQFGAGAAAGDTADGG
jgi:hypothetical protein